MSIQSLTLPARSRWHAALNTPDVKGIALGLVAAAIWGSYLAMAKAGVSAGLGASDIAFIRYGVAGLVMLPWLMRHGMRTCAGVGWSRAAVLAALVGPLFILVGVGGYSFAPLAHGAVLQPGALTVGSLILAAVFLGDRPTVGRIVGIGVILGGLVVIAGPALLAGKSLTPLGDAMFVVAGLMWAVFTILTKRWSIAPLPATAAVSVLSAAVFTPAYLATVGWERLLAVPVNMILAQVVVQGVLSGVVAVIAFSRAAQLIGAARAALFPALVPAVAIVLGVPIAGEIPTALQLAGLGVVSVGLLIALGVVHLPTRRAGRG